MKRILYDRYLAGLIFRLWLRGNYRMSAELGRLRAAEKREWSR